MLGVIVVGIGIAGRVRIRDLLNPLPNSAIEKLKLIGFVSRRTLGNIELLKQIMLEEALRSDEIHAAIISLENQFHEEYVRKFLDAGKHVCVEYPMALSVAAARELWDLADSKGKILHVEHIELLSAEYKQLKRQVSGKELMEGTLHFTGGPLDRQRTGFPTFSGVSRLSWLVDLFGELTFKSATLKEQQEQQYWKLTTLFHTKNSRPLIWIEERGPGLKRKKSINFQFKLDTLDHIPEVPNSHVGLFMQDLNLFAQKLAGQTLTEPSEKNRILHCLGLADEIRAFCEQIPQN
ncbi:biliverdin reductase A isoform X1 [Carcharodon carcharias]|uniref:biliverdin reductase A isoform X1 n=2 Tax=Carcharodon carcharias TaxID=13397 RepID=UPI001B7EBA8E|nr:biliverdin reductase A isoform X1 [Carcharodon carcharias]XP_041039618.1 biliverdin reductase A isoform X1 [Carcharodon carcharias]XP_041039619.1 biliverdin reductase A isoform X1 [Carcharodon carcharias]